MRHDQTQELKEHEKERDIFCAISDAFRLFARRSAIMLGSAWAFAAALLVILVWLATGPTFHFPARTELEHFAVRAIRLARVAAAPSVPDQPVAPVGPMLARDQFHQLLFDFFRIFLFR